MVSFLDLERFSTTEVAKYIEHSIKFEIFQNLPKLEEKESEIRLTILNDDPFKR